MNWKEIKEKFPLAFKEFEGPADDQRIICDGWDCCTPRKWFDSDDDFRLRDLYDFFDDLGIHVTVCWEIGDGAFHYRIHSVRGKEHKVCWVSGQVFDDRVRCEEAAFTTAFKKTNEMMEAGLIFLPA